MVMGRGPTKEYHMTLNENYVEGSLTNLKGSVIKSRLTTEFPLILNIEPTNSCNAHCYYCARDKMVKDQGISLLSMDTFRKIIDQIGKDKLIMLNLHKDGEPLLNRDIPEMVEYALEKEAANIVHLNTNGILLNGKTGRGVIEKGIDDITVSIDASHEETYCRFKKLKNLLKLEENVVKAIEFRNKVNSPTKIRVKIMEFEDIEKEEIEHFQEKWTGVADEVQVTGIHSWSGSIEGLKITDEQSANRYPCAILWYALAINSNGKASVCNFDWNYSGVVGNINKQSIMEIWNGYKLKEIRRAHLKGIWDFPNICKECVGWVCSGDLSAFFHDKKEFY